MTALWGKFPFEKTIHTIHVSKIWIIFLRVIVLENTSQNLHKNVFNDIQNILKRFENPLKCHNLEIFIFENL